MTDKEELNQAWELVKKLKQDIKEAEQVYYDLFYHLKDNKFTDQQLAEATINSILMDLAVSDCEGSYNCGSSQYTQQFYVNDVLYEGVLDVEYNKYYVERTDFKVEKVTT